MKFAHDNFTRNNIPSILWGCSVEENRISEDLLSDFRNFSAIIARESITYESLKKHNLNVFLYPDPAFTMRPTYCEDLNDFDHVVGVNVSPLIMTLESNNGILLNNYINMLQYILDDTDYNIALIPHVVWEGNNDLKPIKYLQEHFGFSPRIKVLSDHAAPELKYLISKCELFVGARTHATIAAYSSCVPTLVVGYSVKANGIAKDLFGSTDQYVLPVQEMHDPFQLRNSFKWLESNKALIKAHLEALMPEYIERAYQSKEVIWQVMKS